MRNRSYDGFGVWLQKKWENSVKRLAEAKSILDPLLEDPAKNITEAILLAEISAERDAETTPLRTQTQRRTQKTLDTVATLHRRTQDLKDEIRRETRLLDETQLQPADDTDELSPPTAQLQAYYDLRDKEIQLHQLQDKLNQHRTSLGARYAKIETLITSRWTQLRIRLLAKKQILRAKLRERKNHYRQADRTSHLASNPANHHPSTQRSGGCLPRNPGND